MMPRPWIPHQHGAWAMLSAPLLLGVAAGGADPAQLLLLVAALFGYLASAAAQAWIRARTRSELVPWLRRYVAVSGIAAAALLVREPRLLVAALVIVPVGALGLLGARRGSGRALLDSIAQVVLALVLVPAAALLGGSTTTERLGVALALALVHLVGTVLVVRSVIRERDNPAFAALSAGWHATALLVAALLLPLGFAVVGFGLTVRAVMLPLIRRRRAAQRRPLRPVVVGIVELVAAIAVVTVAFGEPLALR